VIDQPVIAGDVRTVDCRVVERHPLGDDVVVIMGNHLQLRVVPHRLQNGGRVEQGVALREPLGQQRVVDPKTRNTLHDVRLHRHIYPARHYVAEPVHTHLVDLRPCGYVAMPVK
jgi:hypothetical protein